MHFRAACLQVLCLYLISRLRISYYTHSSEAEGLTINE